MHRYELPGGVIELHDSPRKIPESRRIDCDFYSLVHSAIGSTSADIDRHFQPLSMLIGGDPQAQLDGLNNLRYLLYNIMSKQTSPRSLALGCLVETIDGEKWNDYSEDGLVLLVQALSDRGLTDEIAEELLIDLKKKS